MKKIHLTIQQVNLVKQAVKENNPKSLYQLFANIVSNQFFSLNKLTDYGAMMYLHENHIIIKTE